MKTLPTIRLAQPTEWQAALRLLLGHLEPDERDRRVQRALSLFQRGEISADGLLIARDGAKSVAGAVLGLRLPGATGLIWPPACIRSCDVPPLEDALLQHVTAWLRELGARMAHILLAAEDQGLAACLPRNGFSFMTQLIYLRHDLTELPAVPSEIHFEPYSDATADPFVTTLLRTYEGSRDCPELNGVQSAAEILEAHRGQSSLRHWWLARHSGAPIGVLLLAEQPEQGGWELAYLGVVPKARGRKFGQALIARALQAAHAARVGYLFAAVDERNRPAYDLYTRLGFVPYDSRAVYLAIWSRHQQQSAGQ